MTLTLRQRILLTLVPLLALLAVLGGAGVVLLSRLGGRINEILRENYDSVLYMERLNEALERIDSAFTFALAGREKLARRQYDENWMLYRIYLDKEQDNITLKAEDVLVEQLAAATEVYRERGEAFFSRSGDPRRHADYFGEPERPGLYDSFQTLKSLSGQILRLNQENMEQASRDARATATASLIGFGVGLAAAAILALLLARHTGRTILQPIRAVTESALAIGAGNLDQVVPVISGDELGQLAGAFNTMARQLRHFRQSQQSRLLRLQQTSQATIDSFPHPVLVVDLEGHVEMANPAVRRLLGVMVDAGVPKASVTWQPPEALREPLQAALRQQRAYVPQGFEHAVAMPAAGELRYYLPRILPIRDPEGTTLGAAVLLEDVTRFRLLDEVKSNLVATVSHELKTPLASLRLAVHLLLEETVGPLTPKQLELLLDARDNTERLLAMIENLLDLARLQEGRRKLDLQPCQPADLLRAAADTVRPRAEDKGVDIRVEVPGDIPVVAADVAQFGHALHNLLDNALRYTDTGGHVTLAATATRDLVTLTVSDSGAGIPPDHLPHIFDKFFRVPGQSPEQGTGLGLAIVWEIVTAHGGTIRCESQLGEGTCFTLTLPSWPAGAPVEQPGAPAALPAFPGLS